MKKHEILSPQSRAALFDPPTEPAAIVRHYTFSAEDLALIRQRRRATNRLGFAVHLAYLRFPGRVLGAEEAPPADMLGLHLVADRMRSSRRSRPTRGAAKHVGSILANFKPISARARFSARTIAAVAHVAIEQATGSDRGDVIVSAMIQRLRDTGILLPATAILERSG